MADIKNIDDFIASLNKSAFDQPERVEINPNAATPEQEALSNELVDMLSDLYAAEGDEKDKLNAVYTAKRDAILAINPDVHAGVADPDGMEFYHNIHKSEYGFRPRGHFTYAEMRADIERICKTAENITVEAAA